MKKIFILLLIFMMSFISADIGGWDSSGCIFLLAPACLGAGSNPDSANTGTRPSFPDSAYQDVTLVGMGAGYGFVKGDTSCYNFDNTNDIITTNLNIPFTATNSFTLEAIVYRDSSDEDWCDIAGAYDSATSQYSMEIRPEGYLQFYMSMSPYSAYSRSTEALSTGIHTIHFLKTAASPIRLFIDGVECTYSVQGWTNQVTDTLTDNISIGNAGDNGAVCGNKIYWVAIYNDTLSHARMLTNSNLGVDMGLEGYNDLSENSLRLVDTCLSITGLVAGGIGQTEIKLDWTKSATPEAESTIIRYSLTDYPADSSGGILWTSLDTSLTSDTITGLTGGLTYYVSLFAIDSNGNWSSADSDTATTYPIPVTGYNNYFNKNRFNSGRFNKSRFNKSRWNQ